MKNLQQKINQLWQESLTTLWSEVIPNTRKKSFFAPLYLNNFCVNNCPYCAFRKDSKIKRRTLNFREATQEANYLKQQGYDTAYVLTGSLPEKSLLPLNKIGLQAVSAAGLFPVLESSPFSEPALRELLAVTHGKGRYVLFQECYNEKIFTALHQNNIYKNNFQERLAQIDSAIAAGWKEIGIGTLLGLNKNLPEELYLLLSHADKLLQKNITKLTISVPRLTSGQDVLLQSRCTDEEFIKILLIIRILCPKAYLVITGRETATLRDRLWSITDIWGVRGATEPGGYTLYPSPEDGQFMLYDRRNIQEILLKH